MRIFKPRGDYFQKVTFSMKRDKVIFLPSATMKVVITENDTIYPYAVKLANGYIASHEIHPTYDVVTSLTYKDAYKIELELGTLVTPSDTLKKYIIDKDPYLEIYADDDELFIDLQYFVDNGKEGYRHAVDTAGLNRLIRRGELGKYLTKEK